MRLSTPWPSRSATSAATGLEQLREGDSTRRASTGSSTTWPTRSSSTTGSATIDVDLVQALLYLQSDDPRIKARVLKYLRCEDLTPHDRRLLGRDRPPDLRRRPAAG